jgi:WD40 repeat protein
LQQAESERTREAEVSRRFAQQSSQSDFLLASLYARDDLRRALARLSRALKSNPENHAAETLGWSLLVSIPFSLVAFQHEVPVHSASFSPDGTRVVTASWDNAARVWDARSGQPLTGPL